MTAPPQEFLCPLTLEIMNDPVMNRMGQNYERSAITHWVSQPNAMCPLTRKPIRLNDFVSNKSLQIRIQKWKLEQGHEDSTDETSELSFSELLGVQKVFVNVKPIKSTRRHSQSDINQRQLSGNMLHQAETTRRNSQLPRRRSLLRFLQQA